MNTVVLSPGVLYVQPNTQEFFESLCSFGRRRLVISVIRLPSLAILSEMFHFFFLLNVSFFNKTPLIKYSNITYYALVLRLFIYDGISFDVEHRYISTI